MRLFPLIAVAIVVIGASVTNGQTPPTGTKQPGLTNEKRGPITNYRTTDTVLAKQAQKLAALTQRPVSENASVVLSIAAHSNELEPAFLYEMARRLWDMGRIDDALEWFAIAGMRARYDAFRCTDATARQGILMLPSMAANVQAGIEQYRTEFGAAGLRALTRPNLFLDSVSPWWICVHGMAAVRSAMEHRPLKEAEWLTPQSEWPALRENLRQMFATYFAEQGKPQDDPIPMAKTPYKISEIGRAEYGSFAWLDENSLVIGKTVRQSGLIQNSLKLWRRDGKSREIARVVGPWCAGGGVVSWALGYQGNGENRRSQLFVRGMPNKLKEFTVEFEGRVRYAELVHGASGWSSSTDPIRQSPFDCRWVRSERLSAPKKEADWIPLLPGHGFLAFSTLAGQPAERLLYYPEETGSPVELPIPTKNVRPDSVRYFKFRDAYFISPLLLPLKTGEQRPSCISVWWFEPRRARIEDTCMPTDALSRQFTTYSPSRVGMLRAIPSRRTPHGDKPGGIYLQSPDGHTEKIYEGIARGVSVSPDGCAVAVQCDIPQRGVRTMSVIELCGGGISASPATSR